MPYSTGAPMLSPAELQKFEAPLIALANMSGGDLRKLFHAFFSFLHRRTDFYCIGGGKMGFQEGQAEQILLASFRQFPLRRVGPKPAGVAKSNAAPSAAKKEEVHAKKETAAKPKPTLETSKPLLDAGPKSKGADGNKTNMTTDTKENADIPTAEPAPTVAKEKVEKKKTDIIRYTEEGKQIPVGNGGSTSRYVWTQVLEEVTVHIPLPEGVRAKELDIKIGASSLSIKQKNGEGDNSSFVPIEGTLFGKIRPSESTWTIETTTHSSQTITTLQLILDKVQKTWWATVLSGDTPLIDTTLVDSTRHIDTYDGETQGQIRRILHDQRQERLGLTTSQDGTYGSLPPLPNGQKLASKPEGGGGPSLPDGVEYIDGETLEKASISKK